MLLTYFKFIILNIIRKKPIWITWLLFLVTCTSFLIILPIVGKINPLQLWANTSLPICQTFLWITIALFSSIITINIFKDINEEGTELIIISKPLTKIQITIAKFFLFFVVAILISLSALIISLFTIFLPYMEKQFYWKLNFSMFIGNMAAFSFFGSISIILSTKFVKIGIIIINALFCLITFIFQCLTFFVFSTPSIALTRASMSAPSFVVANRDIETGQYTEDEIVKFEISVSDDGQINYPTDINNWQDMKVFWEDNIKSKDQSKYLNIFDLGSQLSLSYMGVGLNNFSQRTAKRSFAVSRFYDYNLSCPASAELIDPNIKNKKNLNMMYTGFNNIQLNLGNIIDINFVYPTSFGFLGIDSAFNLNNIWTLKGINDSIPIGYIKNKNSFENINIYFEPNEYMKYKNIFKEIYLDVYDEKHYRNEKRVSTNPLDWSILFCMSNENIGYYYELVWQKMHDHMSVLDIKTVDDLNTRFIQYKYFAFLQASQEQNNYINNMDNLSHEELEAKTQVEKELQPFYQLLGIESVENTWLMRSLSNDSSTNIPILPTSTQAIDFTMIYRTTDRYKTILSEKQLDEEQYNKTLLNSTYCKITKTMNIFNTTVLPYEKYLFSSLNNPNRTTQYNGGVYAINDVWLPNVKYPALKQLFPQYINDMILPFGQNTQYFFYDVKQNIDFNWFIIKWFILSFILFFIGAIVYKKYDIK